MEDGEIIEKELDNDNKDSIDDDLGNKNSGEQLSGDVDFLPPIGQHLAEGQIQPSENWKEGWMKISRDAISWNQANKQNQNLVKSSWNNQSPILPPPPPPPPPQFQQLSGT